MSPVCLCLLIEPVWNRNIGLSLKRAVAAILLIEPVWNRNCVEFSLVNHCQRSFNRTSMESKRERALPSSIHASRLLIEPVWNRNFAWRVPLQWRVVLLIEPVWNRNTVTPYKGGYYSCAFNRTSMESKLAFLISAKGGNSF